MLKVFLMDMLHRPRREITKRNKVSVISQVLQFKFSDNDNKQIVRGWLHIADCLAVNPEKLRAVDNIKLVFSLDWTNGDISAALDQLLSKEYAVPLSDETTLIELSKMVGYLKNSGD